MTHLGNITEIVRGENNSVPHCLKTFFEVPREGKTSEKGGKVKDLGGDFEGYTTSLQAYFTLSFWALRSFTYYGCTTPVYS
jgi:hypothetical protein